MDLNSPSLVPLIVITAIIMLSGIALVIRGLRTLIPMLHRLRTAHVLSGPAAAEVSGRVVRSEEHRRTTRDGFELEMRELIEFTTLTGHRITGSPVLVDVSSEDRTDRDVTVLYDPHRPERFIAPADGDGIDWKRHVPHLGSALLQVTVGAAMALFTAQFVVPLLRALL